MTTIATLGTSADLSITTPKGLSGKVAVWKAPASDLAPVVFLHGATGLLAPEPFLELLSASRDVYAPEWPSFGEEEGEEVLEDMLDFALHGADLLVALGKMHGWEHQPVLIGHDMGAMIAAEMACLSPTSISNLVLLSPIGLWDAAHPIVDIFALLPYEFPEWLFVDQELGTRLLARGLDFEHPDALETFLVRNSRQLGMAGKIMFPIPNRRLSKRLYRCDTPALLAWGSEDRLTPTEPYATLWQQSLPHAKTVRIEHAGHMVHHEQPESLARALNEYLS